VPDANATQDKKEIERQKEIPRTEMVRSIIDMYTNAFRLPSKPDCKELDEILKISPGELVDKDLHTCQKYLWALGQWTLFLRREKNLRMAYFVFDVKRPFMRTHGKDSLKAKRGGKWDRYTKATKNPTIEKDQIRVDVAEAFAQSMEGFLEEANELKQALKRIITTKEQEYEQSLWSKKSEG